jgi:hypothetical protein
MNNGDFNGIEQTIGLVFEADNGDGFMINRCLSGEMTERWIDIRRVRRPSYIILASPDTKVIYL